MLYLIHVTFLIKSLNLLNEKAFFLENTHNLQTPSIYISTYSAVALVLDLSTGL